MRDIFLFNSARFDSRDQRGNNRGEFASSCFGINYFATRIVFARFEIQFVDTRDGARTKSKTIICSPIS